MISLPGGQQPAAYLTTTGFRLQPKPGYTGLAWCDCRAMYTLWCVPRCLARPLDVQQICRGLLLLRRCEEIGWTMILVLGLHARGTMRYRRRRACEQNRAQDGW